MSEEKVIKRDVATNERLAKEYLDSKKFLESIDKRTSELKSALTQILLNDGVADEKGNLWCPAGNYQLKRERRSSVSFDLDAAEAWAREHGHYDAVKEVVERVSEEKVLALGWEYPEIAAKIQSFYKEKESWAFKVVEGKSYDDD